MEYKGLFRNFRHMFAIPAGVETLRAFLFFGVLLVALVIIAGQLAFRHVNVEVLTNRLELVRQEAEEIAKAVTHLGSVGGSIDFSRVRMRQTSLLNMVHERFNRRYLMQHVEIRDRFGVRQLLFLRDSIPREPRRQPVPADWPGVAEQIVTVTLGQNEGEVRVGVSSEALLSDLKALQSTLRTKVIVATVLAVTVLVAGFVYVLYLLRKNRLLEQARQSAARASYIGLLASGLAHEIRNPLNAMNMNMQMLEEELQMQPTSDDQEYRELLDGTKSEIKRLERLVNNFLAYARPSPPRFEVRDLNEIVAEVVRFLEIDFRQSEVGLELHLEPLLPHVEVDEPQFKQALMNLLVNARQVLKAGGNVQVRSRAGSTGDLLLEIEDDGPGIPTEARERIFEVFYSSRGGGTGLGLPIVKQVVESHGGRIEVSSKEGVGTTFRIHLPRHHRRRAESPRTVEKSG